MPKTPTKWYSFRRPLPTDPMNVPNLDITDSLEKIEASAGEVVMPVAPLPSSGYKWGDRLFIADPSINSSFLCLNDNDGKWGHVWMPVQDQNSPWRAIPAATFSGAFIPHPTFPLQISCTNQGQIWFRGAIQATGTMVNDSDEAIFFDMPEGIRPPTISAFQCSIDPTDFDAGTTYLEFKGARLQIREDGVCNIRIHGSTAVTTTIWLNQVRYFAGRNDYREP